MAPLSLRIVMDEGAVTRTVKFDSSIKVSEAHAIVEEKMMTAASGKEYRLFLTSTDNERSGIWLEDDKTLSNYILHDGDSLHYLCKTQNLRIKMLDGSVKTLLVDKAMPVGELMQVICHKIGLANHDEYGLCHENAEEPEETNPAMGTLTMKKKPQHREKDAKLEHLSKKLKTDDNVLWLDQHQSLRELSIDPSETLLLKRRLFYSDRKVDSRDPVQLNLLYVQARDAILDGRHPVTADKAVEFAGLQCQVQFGDYQGDKHKPGFIEDLKGFLPEQYAGSRSIEKKILKEYQKHQGLGEVEAKNLYTKTARDLPTYGVTFFLVKEKQKGVKKLVPRLLGISCESILRLDEVTKEILQTWPLTQVKTFRVGKTETFTLDFGDYSDKEYSVKTNEGFRIRDILQGYIDLIGRRMKAGPFNVSFPTGGQLLEDQVKVGRSNIMEHVTQTPTIPVEASFVGPSKIISYEPGQMAMQGTQILMASQLVIADKSGGKQRAVKGGVPMRSDMSKDFVKKLNSLNSNSVKIVTLLTEPTEANIEETKKIVTAMEEVMPEVTKGVKEVAEKQSQEEVKNKLLSELHELEEYLASLGTQSRIEPFNAFNVEDVAKNIADLSTQIYFSLDSKTRRRSDFVNRSRQSFMEDDATRATLHRASFIATSATTCHGINNCLESLDKDYTGPALQWGEVPQVEAAAVDHLGKLNAAIALLLDAHADTKNIDYGAALNSLNNINELLPELCTNIKGLSGVKDEKSRQALLDELRALCEAARNVCMSTGSEDHSKLQEASNNYANISGKLIYKFGRGEVDPDKENEIIDLAREVGNKTSIMLVAANELATMTDFGLAANDVDAAGVRCADAARALLAAAQLTAPSIREPHCQSALTAAAENLSSSAQHLATTWKPLVEQPGQQKMGEELRSHSLELAKALDRLKDAYANLNDKMEIDKDDEAATRERHRLKFITTLSGANDRIQDAERKLLEPISTAPVTKDEFITIQQKYTKNMGQLNGAISSLLAALSNSQNPDYAAAESALNTVGQLIPKLVENTRSLGTANDGEARQKEMQSLMDLVRRLCSCSGDEEPKKIQEAVNEYANLSNKLIYTHGIGACPDRQRKILVLANEVRGKMSVLLEGAAELSTANREDPATVELDKARATCVDAANNLLNTAQITAPAIEDLSCLNALTVATENLTAAAQHMAFTWRPLVEQPSHQKMGQYLQAQHQDLSMALHNLRHAYNNLDGYGDMSKEDNLTEEKSRQRLRFKSSTSAALDSIRAAESCLDKPNTHQSAVKGAEDLQQSYSDSMARLNAAIAALLAALSDENYSAAKAKLDDVTELMPEVLTNAAELASTKNDNERKELSEGMRKLCDTVRNLCISTENPEEMKYIADSYANTSKKLIYTFGRGVGSEKENQIIQLAKEVRERTSELVGTVEDLTASEPPSMVTAEVSADAVNCSNAAKLLLTTAQVTAPSIQEPQCQNSLTSASQTLSASVQKVAFKCKPLIGHPKCFHLGEKLQSNCINVNEALDRLKKSYITCGDKTITGTSAVKEKQRLKFITSLAAAEDKIVAAEKQLQEPIKSRPMKEDQIKSIQHKFSIDLDRLNAAIAALVAATADRTNPDYAAAESAVNVITQLIPVTIEDSRKLSGVLDDRSKEALLNNTKALCDAARNICSRTNSNDLEKIQEAANTYSNASRKLIYGVSHGSHDKDNEIIDLAKDIGDKTSRLLVAANELVVAAESDPGVYEVDAAGVNCADTARALLATAQVTAPSIHEPSCQAALALAMNNLSSKAQNLADAWMPFAKHPARKHLNENLQQRNLELSKALEQLRNAFKDLKNKPQTKTSAEKEKQRLKFVTSLAAAEDKIVDVEKQLQEPTHSHPMKEDQIKATQHKFSNNLDRLNAAIAALVAATADRTNPDYAAAESAVKAITQLIPTTIEDSRALCGALDNKSKQALLQNTKALCDAARNICACTNDDDLEKIQEAANSYANASRKLIYGVHGGRHDKDNQIIDLAKDIGDKTSSLLVAANELVVAAETDPGVGEVDAAGVSCADSARALLATAQVTAPSIHEPRCQAALTAAVDNLSSKAKSLAEAWKPLAKQPGRKNLNDNLLQFDLELSKALEQLKNAFRDLESPVSVVHKKPLRPNSDGKHRAKLINTIAATENSFKDAEKQLNTPVVAAPLQQDKIVELQNEYGHNLELLNSSIAAFVSATANREKPDYGAAEVSVNNIKKLVPIIIKDSKSLSSTVEDQSKEALLKETQALCDAIRMLYSAATNVTEDLQGSANAYAEVSSRLIYMVGRGVDPRKESEIIDQAKEVGNKTSSLLLAVNKLTSAAASDPKAGELDAAGSDCAETARTLLAMAQITAPSINQQHCRDALDKAVGDLSVSVQQLAAAWKPLMHDPNRRKLGDNLQHRTLELAEALDDLRKTYSFVSDKDGVDAKTNHRRAPNADFINSVNKADSQIKAAEKLLNEPMTEGLLKEHQTAALQNKYSKDMERLNDAVDVLIAATSHKGKPDFAAAESAVNTIQQLIPEVVKDTKSLAGGLDDKSRRELLQETKALCDAARNLCAIAASQDVSKIPEASDAYRKSSNKLVHELGKGRSSEKEGVKPAHAERLATIKASMAQHPCHQQAEKTVGSGVKSAEAEKQRAELMKNIAATQNAVQAAEKYLNQPVTVPAAGSREAATLQHDLPQNLARLNAALAAFVSALANRGKSNYEAAEEALATISETLPHVTKDTIALTVGRDEKIHREATSQLKKLIDALGGICTGAQQHDPAVFYEPAAEFAAASGKLFFIVSPSADQLKENQVLDLTMSSCEKTSQLLYHVRELAEAVGQEDGSKLDYSGAKVADAAQDLLTTAQITAPCLSDPQCQLPLLSSVDAFSSSIQDLFSLWRPLTVSKHKPIGNALEKEYSELELEIEKLRDACGEEQQLRQNVQSSTKKAPPVPVRRVSRLSSDKAPVEEQTQEFLNQLRKEEIHRQKIEAQKLRNRFDKCIEDANRQILTPEIELKKVFESKTLVSTDIPVEDLQKRLEQEIAKSAVAAASLVACNQPENMDYGTASDSAEAFYKSVAQIVEYATPLSSSLEESSRKVFVENVLDLSKAARRLCDTANTETEKLNEAAVAFGDKSVKLLYAVSEDVDPSQEKEVIARARAIGEAASRVALDGAELATNAPGDTGRELCRTGRACADAAGTLVYTAKLLAPTIQVAENQKALAAATKNLSSEVKVYTTACKQLASDPKNAPSLKKLNTEADQLENLLMSFTKDLEAGKLIKRREDKLVVEDTPLRQLATKILNIAKKKTEASGVSPDERRTYADYAKKLADAIRLVDMANAKCKRSPHDSSKRLELEDVIQNLQQTLLLTRPSHGTQRNNIIDLADFVKDVSLKAEKLIDTSNKAKFTGATKSLEGIIKECHQINLNEFRLLKAEDSKYDTTLEKILEVKYFGQDCDSRLPKINANIQNIEEHKIRNIIQDQATPLAESCDYLKFATRSGLATALTAAFDKALYDLIDFEKKIDKMLVPSGGEKTSAKFKNGSSSLLLARAKLLTAVAEAARPSGAPRIAGAFTKYVAEMRARTDLTSHAEKEKLTAHLKKLLHLLKTMTVSTSRRIVTWQPVEEAEVAAITEQIIQELEYPQGNDPQSTKPKTQILESKDVSRLLLPFNQVKVEGDKAKLEERLQHVATKLNSVSGTVLQSVRSPEALGRSARAAVDAAVELAAVARALDDDKTEPSQNTKVEEAVQDMSFATYNLLKNAECASQEPNNSGTRRRLLDACGLLNDSINKLGHTTASSNQLRRECDESIRSLQYGLQLGALQNTSSNIASSSYADCFNVLAQQKEDLQKLKDDKRMSRDEFSKALSAISSTVCASSEYAAQCAFLLSISNQNKDMAEAGMVDVPQIKKTTAAIQDSCSAIFVHSHNDEAKEEGKKLTNLVQDLQQTVQKATEKIKDPTVKSQLTESASKAEVAVTALNKAIDENNSKEDKITPATISLLDTIGYVNSITEHPSITPEIGNVSAEAQSGIAEITNNSKELTSKALTLIREVKTTDDDDDKMMTWVMFNTNRTGVLDAFEKLMDSIRTNGQKAGLIAQPVEPEEGLDSANKSYLEIQLDKANKWLKRLTTKADVKAAGEKSARSIVELGETMLDELKGTEKEEMQHLINEINPLIEKCTQKYDAERASVLMDRLKELKKAIERNVVTRVVEDFIQEEAPLQDLEIFVDAERDEAKRKFLLEKKIAELLAHLGRVTKTARFVSDTRKGDQELKKCSNQTELLAPILVKAAQERVNSPNNQAAIDKYRSVLAQYAESLSRVRELCDQAVDPMEFVQTAGETMQRMREDSSQHNDPQKCAYTSFAITKLANRVIHVGLSSENAKRDPELQRALAAARERLSAAAPAPDTRASKMPDFNTTTAEILRTAGEVESALGGETIFRKQPEPNQPIYNAALNLHATLREWSARDNDIVAAAKRMAVQMAKLSEHVHADKKRDVLLTSKEIVRGAHEVAELAKKLANECTDLRIRKDLLQVCETIPTISGQLKMLTSIKGTSLGHQGSEEDKEAMNMLIGNAENLMISIQDVVKCAAAASVKIRSQRGGPRIRWVRKNYYL